MPRPKGSKNKGTKKAAPKARGKGVAKASAKSTKSNGAHAKKANGRSEPVIRATYTKRLPVPVGADVVEKAAHEMAKVHVKREAVKEERREAMAGFKEEMAHLDKQMGELADTVNKSTALADVECVEKLIVEDNSVQVIRTDTGECIEIRAADASDRQEALFPDAPTVDDVAKAQDAERADETTPELDEEDDESEDLDDASPEA